MRSEMFWKAWTVFKAINETELIEGDSKVKDTARDGKTFDIKKTEKYCHQSARLKILGVNKRRQKCKWHWKLLQKTISKEDDSIAYEGCLIWVHLARKKIMNFTPKNWFCINCQKKCLE